jgi:hypothetical protein
MTPVDSHFDEALAKLNHLDFVRERLLLRAELLPADLALVGLYNEIREAAFLAVELCHCLKRAILRVLPCI